MDFKSKLAMVGVSQDFKANIMKAHNLESIIQKIKLKDSFASLSQTPTSKTSRMGKGFDLATEFPALDPKKIRVKKAVNVI